MHHSEKRDFKRVPVESATTLTVGQQIFRCTCVDLSTTGAKLVLDDPSGLHTQLTGAVVIQSGGGPTAPLEAEVTLIRVQGIDGGKEEIAVHFDRLL